MGVPGEISYPDLASLDGRLRAIRELVSAVSRATNDPEVYSLPGTIDQVGTVTFGPHVQRLERTSANKAGDAAFACWTERAGFSGSSVCD